MGIVRSQSCHIFLYFILINKKLGTSPKMPEILGEYARSSTRIQRTGNCPEPHHKCLGGGTFSTIKRFQIYNLGESSTSSYNRKISSIEIGYKSKAESGIFKFPVFLHIYIFLNLVRCSPQLSAIIIGYLVRRPTRPSQPKYCSQGKIYHVLFLNILNIQVTSRVNFQS